MNKTEKKILLDTYKSILEVEVNTGINKGDSIREFKSLLDNLNLKIDRYRIENKVIADKMNFSNIQTEAWEMIFNDCIKYGSIENYGDDLLDALYNLECKLTEEELKCNMARVKLLSH